MRPILRFPPWTPHLHFPRSPKSAVQECKLVRDVHRQATIKHRLVSSPSILPGGHRDLPKDNEIYPIVPASSSLLRKSCRGPYHKLPELCEKRKTSYAVMQLYRTNLMVCNVLNQASSPHLTSDKRSTKLRLRGMTGLEGSLCPTYDHLQDGKQRQS